MAVKGNLRKVLNSSASLFPADDDSLNIIRPKRPCACVPMLPRILPPVPDSQHVQAFGTVATQSHSDEQLNMSQIALPSSCSEALCMAGKIYLKPHDFYSRHTATHHSI